MEIQIQPDSENQRYANIHVKIQYEGIAYISWQGPTMPRIYLEVRNGNDYPQLMYLSFLCSNGFEITYNDAHANDRTTTNFPNGQFAISTPIQFTEIQGGTFRALSSLQTLYQAIGHPDKRDWSLPPQPLEGNLTIAGQNPPKNEIENYINDLILIRICREFSGYNMFDNNGSPLYNTKRNGYGLFALENCSASERWNWKRNIDKAREVYNSKISDSNNYSNSMCQQNKGLPPLNDLQLKINAAQLFDKFDSDTYWVPKKTGFLFWEKWTWVPKIAGGNRLGDMVQRNN